MKFEKRSTREILALNRRRTSPLGERVILMAHNIRSLHNVGALFRSADGFGIGELWLSGYTPRPPRAEISKTALGSEESVRWHSVEKPAEEIQQLKASGFEIWALEQTHQSRMLTEIEPGGSKVCLLIGNEVTGVDEELLRLADSAVEIPQFGEKHSLNVSVAAGIALYALLEKFESNHTR